MLRAHSNECLMPPETEIQQHMPADDLHAWLVHHPVVATWSGAFCLWVSISLIIRMWLVHRRATVIKKLTWSVLLLIPLFGWFLYAGCFHPPDYTDIPIPETPGLGGA